MQEHSETRWALLGFGVCYGVLMLAEKFIEVFS